MGFWILDLDMGRAWKATDFFLGGGSVGFAAFFL
jgi:hypothetical protein